MLSVSNDYASFCKHGLSMVTSVVSEFRGGREKKHACPPSWGLPQGEKKRTAVFDSCFNNTW